MARMYPGRTLGSAYALDPQYSPLKLNYDVGESREITINLFNHAMKGPENSFQNESWSP